MFCSICMTPHRSNAAQHQWRPAHASSATPGAAPSTAVSTLAALSEDVAQGVAALRDVLGAAAAAWSSQCEELAGLRDLRPRLQQVRRATPGSMVPCCIKVAEIHAPSMASARGGGIVGVLRSPFLRPVRCAFSATSPPCVMCRVAPTATCAQAEQELAAARERAAAVEAAAQVEQGTAQEDWQRRLVELSLALQVRKPAPNPKPVLQCFTCACSMHATCLARCL